MGIFHRTVSAILFPPHTGGISVLFLLEIRWIPGQQESTPGEQFEGIASTQFSNSVSLGNQIKCLEANAPHMGNKQEEL